MALTRDAGVLRLEAHHLDEPQLLFNGHHRHVDPKAGLEIYGPFSVGDDSLPMLRQLSVGIVAPASLVTSIRGWLQTLQHRVAGDSGEPFSRPGFPGIAEDTSFQCRLTSPEVLTRVVAQRAIAEAMLAGTEAERIAAITAAYGEQLRALAEREPMPDVVVLGLPEDMIQACAGAHALPETHGLAHRRRGQLTLNLGVEEDEAQDWTPPNLRTALKGVAMPLGLATQIIKESTLRPGDFNRKTQDAGTRAWNFSTALYYKAGGHPWRLADARPGTCYLGIDFFVDRAGGGMRAGLAQVFSERGEGLVLRGRPFEWQGQGRTPHLTRFAMRDLMTQVLEVYQRNPQGALPERLVVHKSSLFTDEEQGGIRDVTQEIGTVDLLVVAPADVQVYRPGRYPPLRGTAVRFGDDEWLLYSRGFVPYLRTYPGMRVPRPLLIRGLAGDTPPDVLLREILALSKMNWNTADFAGDMPITLAFADRVGAILGGLAPDAVVRPEYRFYM